jgi:hypothetical protein
VTVSFSSVYDSATILSLSALYSITAISLILLGVGLHLGHDVLWVEGEVFVLSELHVAVDGAKEQLLQKQLVLRLRGKRCDVI